MDDNPKLRPLNLRWAQWEGQQVLVLQDPLRLSQGALMVPAPVAPVLGLLDGTRDLDALLVGFLLRTGMQLTLAQIETFVSALDEALLLDNERFNVAQEEALLGYRSGPFRMPALAGEVYPEDPKELRRSLDEYVHRAGQSDDQPNGRILGVISPHIDYARGWRTYVDTWIRARAAVEEADLVIVLGTDHGGTPGSLTVTKQSYATPWGVLPTNIRLVDQLVNILGEERAFAEEMHHIGEHSIELAAVWLHYIAGEKPKTLLPLLCGPDEAVLVSGDGGTGPLREALSYLKEVTTEPGVLVVAAGDVSHVGPAFGDPLPLDVSDKARIRSLDQQWLQCACTGRSELLTDYVREHGDHTRICGAAPIHYMLTLLDGIEGRVVAYDQCSADENFGSLVSVAGALFAV